MSRYLFKNRLIFTTLVIIFSFVRSSAAVDPYLWITIDYNAIEHSKALVSDKSALDTVTSNGISLIKVRQSDLENLSNMMHYKFNRCGGFVRHDSHKEGLAALRSQMTREFAAKSLFSDYSIDNQNIVNPMIAMIDEANILTTILNLSLFHNRYYKSDSGVASSQWIKTHWESITQGRSDITVENLKHESWPQSSIIMTVRGWESPEEVIVLGGHADSIALVWEGSMQARAPGADDNASGIATLTETIRIMVQTNYRPKKTIKFMAYSAEEVGLRGSKEIANKFKNDGVNVVGVLQLDMTNFKGSQLDIIIIKDFTNSAQNNFLGALIDEYVHVPWGWDECGYACSDHASWTQAGFPASIPFESMRKEMNRRIHSAKDSVYISGGDTSHSAKFVELAIAYLVELDR